MTAPLDHRISKGTDVFLQKRVAAFAGYGALLLAGLYGVRCLFAVLRAPDRLTSVSYLTHVAAVAWLAVVWLLTRAAERPAAQVRALDTAAFLGAGALCVVACLDMSPIRAPHMVIVMAVTFGLVARAIFVPATPRRTFWLSAILAVAGSVAGGLAFADPGPAYRAAVDAVFPVGFLGELVWRAVAETAAWSAGAVAVATAASRVIYGLRQDVRSLEQLGQYTLVEKLGEGGMGVVYEARHGLLRRPTAVKLLPVDRGTVQDHARFENEVQRTASLTHPNTVTVYDYGRTPDGVLYYAMELLDGATVEQVVALDGPQPAARVVHVLRGCAGALAEAHGIGLVHRDVKPANIMLCQHGGVPDVPKLLDFGLVKRLDPETSQSLTATGGLVGTPQYMAPETVTGDIEPDHRIDLYALGAVGYFLLTGEHLFEGRTAVEVCLAHVQKDPVPPSERLGAPTHPGLAALLLACLEKKPSRRPASARELVARLDALDGIEPWDGAEWWEELGALVHRRTEPPKDPSVRTIAADRGR